MEDEGRLTVSSEFGNLLRRHRLAAGLSQEALAERARLSSIAISALERGQRRRPQRETLALLIGALALDGEQRAQFEEAARSRQGQPSGASVTPGPWAEARAAILPLALNSFVGRDTELADLTGLVRSHRFVTVTGAGGIGKTQAALRVVSTLEDDDFGTVAFVPLAPIAEVSWVVPAIAAALGLQELPQRPLLATVLTALRKRKTLLVIDNAEHVIGEAARVAETLLQGASDLRILATSRTPLKATGERIYRLPPLAIDHAVELFADRAKAINFRFVISQENAHEIVNICRRVDGIPLAIELAAARTSQLSVKGIAESLNDGFSILTGGERTALPRQRTIRAAIDWSYNLLSPLEQRVFNRFSVFANGCTRAVAVAVCGAGDIVEGELLDVLSSLVDKSMVVANLEGTESRYQLLQPFQQYAREKLAKSLERQDIMRRFAIAYIDLAQPLEYAVYYEQEALERLARDELDNWRAVLHWSLVDRGDVLLGQRLVGQLAALWHHVALVDGQHWVKCALSLVAEETPPSVLARLDYTEATIAMALDQLEVQLASSRRAVARYRALREPFWLGLTLYREAQALLYLGRISEAAQALQEGLPLARELHDEWLVGCMLRLASSVSAFEGNLGAARGALAEALRCYGNVKSKRDLAWTLDDLSFIEMRAGNRELALRHSAEALDIFRRLNHARGIAITLRFRTSHLILSARYDEADASAREELTLAREHGLDVVLMYGLQQLAAIRALQSRDLSEPDLSVYAHAARIIGYVDSRLATMGSPRTDEEKDYIQVLTLLHDTLGVDAVAEFMEEGKFMSEEHVIEVALTL